MAQRAKKLISSLVLCTAGFAAVLILGYPSDAADTQSQLLKPQVITWDAAQARSADCGQMTTYFQGQTPGTKDVFVAVAVVERGKALHRAHRHAQEEYPIVASGSATWSLRSR